MRRHVRIEAADVLVERRDEGRQLLGHHVRGERLERSGTTLDHRVTQPDQGPQAEAQAEPQQRHREREHDELVKDRLLPDLRGQLAMRAQRLRYLDQHRLWLRRPDHRVRERGDPDRLTAHRGVEVRELLGRERLQRRGKLWIAEQQGAARRDDPVVDAVAARRLEELERRRRHFDVQLARAVIGLLGDDADCAEQHAILHRGRRRGSLAGAQPGVHRDQKCERHGEPRSELQPQAATHGAA